MVMTTGINSRFGEKAEGKYTVIQSFFVGAVFSNTAKINYDKNDQRNGCRWTEETCVSSSELSFVSGTGYFSL